MLDLTCQKCAAPFSSEQWHGYCPECVKKFREHRHDMVRKQNPGKGVHLDGTFASATECPKSFPGPDNVSRCGLCGSDELESGYGLGTGYGIGGYNFCEGCNTFLDFVGDNDEDSPTEGTDLKEAPREE